MDQSEIHLGQPGPSRICLTSCSLPRVLRTPQRLLSYISPQPHRAYSVALAPRRVGPSHRTIVDVNRAKDEKLEVATKRLARKLKGYLAARR